MKRIVQLNYAKPLMIPPGRKPSTLLHALLCWFESATDVVVTVVVVAAVADVVAAAADVTDAVVALARPTGADTMEAIGLPTGCTRSDVEVGSIQAKVAKYKRACDEMFPGYSGIEFNLIIALLRPMCHFVAMLHIAAHFNVRR